MRNITLAFDDDLVDKGKEYAHRRGISFNALIRESLRRMILSQTDSSADSLFDALDAAGCRCGGLRHGLFGGSVGRTTVRTCAGG